MHNCHERFTKTFSFEIRKCYKDLGLSIAFLINLPVNVLIVHSKANITKQEKEKQDGIQTILARITSNLLKCIIKKITYPRASQYCPEFRILNKDYSRKNSSINFVKLLVRIFNDKHRPFPEERRKSRFQSIVNIRRLEFFLSHGHFHEIIFKDQIKFGVSTFD